MKKLITIIAVLACTLNASAQFESGKVFAGASLSGFDMNYSGEDKFCLGIELEGGYFFADNLLVKAQFGYNRRGNDDEGDDIYAGIGARYYIIQNGLYLGLGAILKHEFHNYNDIMPEIEVGYAFFINHYVTIEPAIYYDQSFKCHSDYSKIGLRVGVGLYLFKE